MSVFKSIADNKNTKSVSHSFRSARYDLFINLLESIIEENRTIQILDIGGTLHYWESMGWNRNDTHITLLNLDKVDIKRDGFSSIKGDATNLTGIQDKSYDIIFSNSVIEHLFTWENQKKMASEVIRTGKNYFIQTPNYWFPIEPHWFFPFFQYFPRTVKIQLTKNFSLGHIGKIPDHKKAQAQVDEVRLLTKKEYKQLFPNAVIWTEKYKGFNKSFVAYKFDK